MLTFVDTIKPETHRIVNAVTPVHNPDDVRYIAYLENRVKGLAFDCAAYKQLNTTQAHRIEELEQRADVLLQMNIEQADFVDELLDKLGR